MEATTLKLVHVEIHFENLRRCVGGEGATRIMNAAGRETRSASSRICAQEHLQDVWTRVLNEESQIAGVALMMSHTTHLYTGKISHSSRNEGAECSRLTSL